MKVCVMTGRHQMMSVGDGMGKHLVMKVGGVCLQPLTVPPVCGSMESRGLLPARLVC